MLRSVSEDPQGKKGDLAKELYTAAERGDELLVATLLNDGAATDYRVEQTSQSALYTAAHNGHTGIVSLLVKAGADVEAMNWSRRTPLHAAASQGHDTVLRVLVLQGSNIAAVDDEGVTALHLAADSGNAGVVGFLMSTSSELDINNTNEAGWTPLHYAAANGHLEVVAALTRSDICDIKLRNAEHLSARDLAVQEGHTCVVEYLDSMASTQKVALVAPKVVRAISTEQIEGLSKQARRVEVQESKRALILANQEKKNAEKQLRHAKNALAKQNDELEALEHQLMDQEAKHQEAIRNLESDNKELKADNTHAHEVYLQLRDSYEAHKVDMATLQATCDRTKGELEEAQQKLTESQNKMEQHRQDAKAQLKALNETRKRADNCGTCTSLRSEVLNLRKSAEELKAESDAAIEKVTLELRVRTDELAAVVVQRDQTESSDTLDVSSERVRQLERDNENLSRQLSAMTEMWESNKTLVEHIKDTSPVHGRELNEDQRMLVDRLSEALSTLGLEGDAEERGIRVNLLLPQPPSTSSQSTRGFLHSLPSYDRYNLMDKSMNLLSLIPQYTPYTLRALVRRFSATFIKTISGTVPSLAIEENLSWVYEDEQPVAMKQERLTEMSVGDIDFVDGTKIAAKVV